MSIIGGGITNRVVALGDAVTTIGTPSIFFTETLMIDSEDYHPQPVHYVYCSACKDEHDTMNMIFENISEGMQGEDRLTFRCPAAGMDLLQTSTVYRKR